MNGNYALCLIEKRNGVIAYKRHTNSIVDVIDEIMKVTDLEKDQILSFMNIPVRALTVEKIKELQDDISREEKRMNTLKNKSIREIYLDSIKFLLI